MSKGSIPGRELPPGRYRFDDVSPGDWLRTGERRVELADIGRFAALTGDDFEIHMSEEGARRHGFPARVAHGLLVLGLVDGLKNHAAAQFRAVASLGWDWTFSRPVFAGDTIRATLTVEAKRATKRPDRGIVTSRFDVLNQQGETVQRGANTLMVWR